MSALGHISVRHYDMYWHCAIQINFIIVSPSLAHGAYGAPSHLPLHVSFSTHLPHALPDWMAGWQVTELTDEACSWVSIMSAGGRGSLPVLSAIMVPAPGLMRETAASALPPQCQEAADKSAVHHEPSTNDMLTNADISLLIDTKRQRWSDCQGFWGDKDKTRWERDREREGTSCRGGGG